MSQVCSNCGQSAGTVQRGRTLYCANCKNNLAGCPGPEEIAEQKRAIKEAALARMRKQGGATVRIAEGVEA
jgi:hypothetical protein